MKEKNAGKNIAPQSSAEQNKTEEDETENNRAKKNRLIYKDYKTMVAKCKTNSDILAWFPTFNKNAEYTLVFPRDERGNIKLRADQFRAAFRDTSNRINQSGIIASKWIDFFPAKLEVNGNKTKTYVKPVLAQQRGSGMNRYECFPPGIGFEIKVKYPSSVLKQSDMRSWVETIGTKGMGAVRQGQFGTFDVLEVKFE